MGVVVYLLISNLNSRKNINMQYIGILLSVKLHIQEQDIRITNVYAPHSPTKAYFQELTSWLKDVTQPCHLIGGDFNCVMQEREDRCYPPPAAPLNALQCEICILFRYAFTSCSEETNTLKESVGRYRSKYNT